jgi:primosomal protein N'
MFCNVIITRPFDQVFTYKLKEGQAAKEGSVVLVPFGKSKNQIGMVSQIN